MTASAHRQEIEQFVALLSEIGLLARSNATVSSVQGGITRVTWARVLDGGLPLGGETVAEYRAILKNREYTCILRDGAIIQLTCVFRGRELVKHRFCWIPAPVHVDQEDALEIDVAELVDHELEEAGIKVLDDDTSGDDLLLVAPVRFDFDIDAHAEHHPACHLTFNRSSCRVPVFGPLSLGHFVRFVFRHFYPQEWSGEPRLRDWALRFGTRRVTADQEGEIFIECRDNVGLFARLAKAVSGR